MPESVYAGTALKRVLSDVAVAVQQLSGFFGKPLYLLLFAGLPVLWLQAGAAAGRRAAVCAVCLHHIFPELYSGLVWRQHRIFRHTRKGHLFEIHARQCAALHPGGLVAALCAVPGLLSLLVHCVQPACLAARPGGRGRAVAGVYGLPHAGRGRSGVSVR